MLEISENEIGYYTIHFPIAGSPKSRIVAIFASEKNAEIGHLGIRSRVFISKTDYPVQLSQATRCRNELSNIVAASPHFTKIKAQPYGDQTWAKLFTPGQPPEDFFTNYTWYSYDNPEQTEEFLRDTIAGI
jgi:hypothetical protein